MHPCIKLITVYLVYKYLLNITILGCKQVIEFRDNSYINVYSTHSNSLLLAHREIVVHIKLQLNLSFSDSN